MLCLSGDLVCIYVKRVKVNSWTSANAVLVRGFGVHLGEGNAGWVKVNRVNSWTSANAVPARGFRLHLRETLAG